MTLRIDSIKKWIDSALKEPLEKRISRLNALENSFHTTGRKDIKDLIDAVLKEPRYFQ
jgi:hypothetical protein